MTKIYLIRHAEAEGNLYRIAQGQANSNLTDRGWKQVRALERRFQDIPVDAVYASDLYRTCATASAVYLPKGLVLHRSPGLREICVGAWEHRSWGEIHRRWPEEMSHFSQRPDLWQVEGAETPQEARDRVLDTLRKIAAENEGKTVAVFSHGYVLRMVLSHLQGIPLEELGKTPTGSNTAVSLLEAEGDALRVIFRDDDSHLKEAERLTGERLTRQASGLEIGLWFAPLRLPEQAEEFAALAAAGWRSEVPFDRRRLLADAAARETLLGYLNQDPVGLLQVDAQTGWISLLCVRPDCRRRGFGVQLLGQAVQRVRAAGGERVLAPMLRDRPTERFFNSYGFRPAPDGGAVEKEIGFDPAFLEKP